MTCLVRCELFHITGVTITYSVHEHDLESPCLWDVNRGKSHISWVLLKAGPQQPTTVPRPGGPEARWPSPDFEQLFCPAVNPRACTDLYRVWACKMDDGEFVSTVCNPQLVTPHKEDLYENKLVVTSTHFLIAKYLSPTTVIHFVQILEYLICLQCIFVNDS